MRAISVAVVVLVLPFWVLAEEGYEETGGPQDPSTLTPAMLQATETIAAALDVAPPAGWKRAGAVERYVPENLYDKINGRSELYMAYDVVGLAFVSLARETAPAEVVDVYLYDMGAPLNAFGIFSVERSGKETPVNIGREGHWSGADLIFWKGRYYVTLLGPNDEDTTRQEVLAIARELEKRLQDDGETLWGLDTMPAENRVERSLQYFHVDAMSLDFLSNTFSAEYRDASGTYRAFVSKQKDETAAKSVLSKYREYLSKYAEGLETHDDAGGVIVSADTGGGYFDAAFQRDGLVAGVTAVKGRDAALAAAKRLRDSLGEQ